MKKELVKEGQLIEFYPKTSFCFLSKARVIKISINKITHISKYRNETIIYTALKSYRTFLSIQEVLNDLPMNDFFRIHKSHIVALRFVNGAERKSIKAGEYYLPITNYYKAELVMYLGRILDKGFKYMGIRP